MTAFDAAAGSAGAAPTCVIVAGPRTARRAVAARARVVAGSCACEPTRPAASPVLELASIATASCAATPTPGAGTAVADATPPLPSKPAAAVAAWA